MSSKNSSGGYRLKGRNWKAILLSIFAALIFWFFNALNKDYSTNLTFPLEFEYNQELFIPVKPLPAFVKLNVKGIGWDLLRRSLGMKSEPLKLPLEKPLEVKRIIGTSLPAALSQQLEKFEINYVITDTLKVDFELRKSKKVKLELDTPSILFRPGYTRINAVSIRPDSIVIDGPTSLINAIPSPLLIRLEERNIDEDYSEEVTIRFLNNEVIYRDPKQVLVKFSVDPLILRTDSVELLVEGDGPKPDQKRIRITVGIPESYRDKYSPDSVSAVIRHSKSGTFSRKKVLPEILGLPPFSKVMNLDSIAID